jgi:choline kinase
VLGTAYLLAAQIAGSTARPVGDLAAYRGDGVVSRWLGSFPQGKIPPLLPVPVGLLVVGVLTFLGLRNLPGILVLTPVEAMLLAAMGSWHPHDGRLDWLTPPLLQAGEYVFLAALGLEFRVPVPVVFALLAAVIVRHADLAHRARAGLPFPADVRGLGWDGRMLLAGVAALAGITPFAYAALSGYLWLLFGWDFLSGWLSVLRNAGHGRRPRLIGMVLAAGAGRRLRPDTDALPKALLPVHGQATILDIALRNLAEVGLRDIVIVVGYAADAIRDRAAALERRHGVRLTLVDNDRAEEWNNAYSLWLAREHFADGALLVNGDTVHPVSVEKTLLSASHPGIILAVDDVKPLAEEEMKVVIDPGGLLTRITKAMDPALAYGEYIGAALIGAPAAAPLAAALEATWRRDPSLYYEDGFQELVDRGGAIAVAPIGEVDWVEVDNHDDLRRARQIAPRC